MTSSNGDDRYIRGILGIVSSTWERIHVVQELNMSISDGGFCGSFATSYSVSLHCGHSTSRSRYVAMTLLKISLHVGIKYSTILDIMRGS